MKFTELLSPLDLFFAERILRTTCEEHLVCAALLFAFYRQGHLALPLSDLMSSLRLLPGHQSCDLDQLVHLVQEGMSTLPSTPAICIEHGRLYLQKNALCEQRLVEHLYRLMRTTPRTFPPVESSPLLNNAQRQALDLAYRHPLSLLVGGPGTGKTYTAAHLVQAFLAKPDARVILTAPTGKAALQLETYVRKFLISPNQIRSGTLHALLGVKSKKTSQESTPLFADLILVDECSMIDAQLFARLLASILPGTRLVLIGDPSQLPSVDAGSVFADLLSASLPMTELTECVRSDRREILTLSAHIRAGEVNEVLAILAQPSETVSCSELHLQDPRMKGSFDHEPDPHELMRQLESFRFLSCMRQGAYGVDALNRHLLEQSFEAALTSTWWVAPILVTRNDPSLELCNGDAGLLVRRMSTSVSLFHLSPEDYALFPDRHSKESYRRLPALALPAYEYGYCLSVHKAQGSEYDEVFILIPPGAEVFGREVLYTAVTRARHRVTLAGSLDTIRQVLQNSARKISGLPVRLRNAEQNLREDV